jgi:hypothetical protein
MLTRLTESTIISLRKSEFAWNTCIAFFLCYIATLTTWTRFAFVTTRSTEITSITGYTRLRAFTRVCSRQTSVTGALPNCSLILSRWTFRACTCRRLSISTIRTDRTRGRSCSCSILSNHTRTTFTRLSSRDGTSLTGQTTTVARERVFSRYTTGTSWRFHD